VKDEEKIVFINLIFFSFSVDPTAAAGYFDKDQSFFHPLLFLDKIIILLISKPIACQNKLPLLLLLFLFYYSR